MPSTSRDSFLSHDSILQRLRTIKTSRIAASDRVSSQELDELETSMQLNLEDGDENSEIISEHLQQLGSRIELLNASLLRAANAASTADLPHAPPEDSATHSSAPRNAGTVPQFSFLSSEHASPTDQDKPGWAALSQEALYRAHENSRSSYLEKLPQGGTVRSKLDTVSVEGRQDVLRASEDVLLGARLSRSPLLKSPEITQASNVADIHIIPPAGVMDQSTLLSSYIRLFLPSTHLALRASRDVETVSAVKLLTSLLAMRKRFIMKWHIFDSPAVVPRPPGEQQRWGTTEPMFQPEKCMIPPNLAGRIDFEDGVVVIYTTLREEALDEGGKCSSTASLQANVVGDSHIRACGDCLTEKPLSITPSRSLVMEDRATSNVETREPSASGWNDLPGTGSRSSVKSSTYPRLTSLDSIPCVDEYLTALREVMRVVQDPACKTLCYQRLRYLEERFSFHLLFNGSQEIADVRNNNHRDFYNVRKVDTHVHHSACMTQKHLLRFIRRKYRLEGDTIVAENADGEQVSLAEIFQHDLGLTAWETSIDHLNVHALNSCFHRFDVFNSKYNPFGAALLREVFLKTDNMIGGRFLAELTREVMDDLEENKYQYVEWRISIYGHSKSEWLKLALWVQKHHLISKNVRWVIQVPRLYHVYRRRGVIGSMQELLSNVFTPIAEAILQPQRNPEIFQLLRSVVAWDSVDDESIVSKFTTAGGDMPTPVEWTGPDNPPYAYWMYYMYANIRAINHLLQARGMNAMPFRPHCGEAGSISHLATAGLLAEGINHGIMLRKSPVLQYLFYLWQIGLAMSPLSNNALFHEITKSPVNSFFRIGLNVSLSSDDPLMFHFTDEALLEEYSVCAHMWKLSPVDLCELARNSVLQSSFEPQYKRHWLGDRYYKKGPRGNNILLTNVPDIRLAYREETLKEELKFLRDVLVTTDEGSIFGDHMGGHSRAGSFVDL